MTALLGFVAWAIAMLLLFPMTFLFTYAWNHSLVELWPPLFPFMGYWHGYLLLTVASFIFPYRVVSAWSKEE